MPTIDKPSKASSLPTKRPDAEDPVHNDLPELESRQAMRLGRYLRPNIPAKVTQLGPVTFDRVLRRKQRGGCRPRKKSNPIGAFSTDHPRRSPPSLGPSSPKRRKIDENESNLIPPDSQQDSITNLLTTCQPVAKQSITRAAHHQMNDRTPSQSPGTLGALNHRPVRSTAMIPKPSSFRCSATQGEPGRSKPHAIADSSRPYLSIIQYNARKRSVLPSHIGDLSHYHSPNAVHSDGTCMSAKQNRWVDFQNKGIKWSSLPITATIRHGHEDSGYQVQLRRFIPRSGERLHVGWDGARLQEHTVPPFAIANMREARIEILRHIDQIVHKDLAHYQDIEATRTMMVYNEVSRCGPDSITSLRASTICVTDLTDRNYAKPRQILSDWLRVRAAEKLLYQPLHIQGGERLGTQVGDTSSIYFGMVLPTPVLVMQFETILNTEILEPLSRGLRDKEVRVFTIHEIPIWNELRIVIAVFILAAPWSHLAEVIYRASNLLRSNRTAVENTVGGRSTSATELCRYMDKEVHLKTLCLVWTLKYSTEARSR
ncbi:hypothetical protein FB567DRAFT_217659 [Paraphoma chrysanthemicola]|uniref:Uncharacterized protein n=1 Tax=Paraphoma chrysanthemicola TaxID=798071 RepID=A0A8K0QVB0_9PLEO|nr:hypothetical protein FB567DRAFT_217659 [Paraphoma chrysanthemicola]